MSKVSSSEDCGEDLRDMRPRGHERHTRIDVVFEKVLGHADAETAAPGRNMKRFLRQTSARVSKRK